MIRETKFFVLKLKDLEDYFKMHPEKRHAFNELWLGIGDMREAQGKKRFNSYVCCNQDEHYIEKVWKAIEEGERQKEAKKC